MHKHWVFGKKWQSNQSHPVSQKHKNTKSQIRHDLKTGKLQRWAKHKKLHLTDSTYDKYKKEVLKK